jgi:hypothetical protein
MRMRGAFAGPESIHRLGPERGVLLGLAEQRPIDADGLYAASMQRWPSQVWTRPAACVSRSTTHSTAWAYGWRRTNPP